MWQTCPVGAGDSCKGRAALGRREPSIGWASFTTLALAVSGGRRSAVGSGLTAWHRRPRPGVDSDTKFARAVQVLVGAAWRWRLTPSPAPFGAGLPSSTWLAEPCPSAFASSGLSVCPLTCLCIFGPHTQASACSCTWELHEVAHLLFLRGCSVRPRGGSLDPPTLLVH